MIVAVVAVDGGFVDVHGFAVVVVAVVAVVAVVVVDGGFVDVHGFAVVVVAVAAAVVSFAFLHYIHFY